MTNPGKYRRPVNAVASCSRERDHFKTCVALLVPTVLVMKSHGDLRGIAASESVPLSENEWVVCAVDGCAIKTKLSETFVQRVPIPIANRFSPRVSSEWAIECVQ